MIHHATGRQVVIPGYLHWTIFPTLGLSADNVQIESPANFAGDGSFVSIGHFTAGIDPYMLTQQKVKITELALSDVKINLVKNTLGQTNWQNPSSEDKNQNTKSTGDQQEESQNPSQSRSDHSSFTSSVTLARFILNNAEIRYQDQQNHKDFKLAQVNLKFSNASFNKTFPVNSSFVLSTSTLSQPIRVNFFADMTVNRQSRHSDEINLVFDHLDAKTNQYEWRGKLEDNLTKDNIAGISGQLTVSGSHGSFKGIDLYYYSDLADALVNKTSSSRQDTHETPFNQLQATLEIEDGLVNNQNLTITAEQMEAKGSGQVNLLTQRINYQLSLQRLTQGKEVKPRGPAIPLIITGDINRPSIRPDWQEFLVGQLQVQLQQHGEEWGKKIDKALQQGLQALVGN